MQRFIVSTTATARVEEKFTIDVPEGVDFDPHSWSSWEDILAQGECSINVHTVDVAGTEDRHSRVVEFVRVGHVADVA